MEKTRREVSKKLELGSFEISCDPPKLRRKLKTRCCLDQEVGH